MRNILILNQMKLKTLEKIHGSGFYEALKLSEIMDKVVFLAYTVKHNILSRQMKSNFFLYAYPLKMTFKQAIRDAIEIVKTMPKIISFINYLIRKHDITYIRAEGVIPWGIISYLVKLFFGIPFSIYLVGNEAEALTAKYKIRGTKLIKKLLDILYMIIFSATNNVSTNLIPLYLELKRFKPRIYFVPTYIDINRFSCNNEIFQENKVKFLYVGRFDKEKGIEILLRVLDILLHKKKNFEFYFIGHGVYEKEIRKLSQKHRQIKFIGLVDHLEMPKWYNKIDVVVLPSLTEGMPAVLMEAMACKRLVIATSVGSIPFLLKDGDYGFLINPNNDRELLELMIKIIDMRDKTLIRDKAYNARKRIEKLIKLYHRNIQKVFSFPE